MITPSRTYPQLILTGLAVMAIALLASPIASAEVGGPAPGEVYREFSIRLTGNDWRVTDPNATHQGTPGNSPADFLPNPIINLSLPSDALAGAVRAEAVIDAWGGHIGTVGLQMRMNGNSWLDIPYPDVTAPPAQSPAQGDECYMHQWNPVVDVPLGHLRNGTNTLQGNSGGQTCYNFNWGQWGWRAFTLRVYYNPNAVDYPSGMITSPASGGSIGDNPTLHTVVASNRPIERIEFLAYYDGYDTDGDGDSIEYHQSYTLTPDNQQPGVRYHVGTATGGQMSVVWDTRFVPDQAPGAIRLMARVCNDLGVCAVSSEVRNVSLARDGETVLLFQPSEVPPQFWVRDFRTRSSKVVIPGDVDLNSAVEAFLLVRTWNGISGAAEPGEDHWRKLNGNVLAPFGANHRFSYDRVPVPINILQNGQNTVSFYAETQHHGVEIQWPGPALLVRFSDEQPTCGDGVVGGLEACDHAGDSPTCDADCTAVACPDGHHNSEAGEECDDGNMNNNDGCRNDCTLPSGPDCGNGEVDPGEQCDTGGTTASCDLDCTHPVCGDGFLNVPAGEQCDDGNTAPGDFCTPDCRIPATNSLPAYYGFEGSGSQVLDSSPSGNHGTLDGAERDSNGRFGQAVRVHGTGQGVDLGYLDFGGGRLTVAAWFRADDFGTSDGRILSKTTSPSDQDHYLMLSTLSSNGAMRLRYRLKTEDGTTHTLIATNSSVQAGVWTHVAASYDGQTMRLYQGGQLVASQAAGGSIAVNPTVPLTLGLNPDGSRPFDGMIDEVRFEARTLTQSEIVDWMNSPVVDTGGCTSDTQCDDGLYCNGAESCDGGECVAGEPVTCRDTLGCTVDSCNEETDSCENAPDDDYCDDGVFCNGQEVCHTVMGCRPGTPVDCSDGVFCTTDSCNEAADRCDHATNDGLCDDGAFCNGVESCDLLAGCSVGTAPCAGSECDEGADECAECLADAHCDDGDFCNGPETCDGGSCVSGGDPCTRAGEECNETTNRCDVVQMARLETVQLTVGGTPERVWLENTYIRPVVVCTVHYGNNVDPVVPRLSLVFSRRFDVRLQNPGGGPVFADSVQCLVGEEGVWDVNGLRFEARRYMSTSTDRRGSWIGQSRSYGQAYAAPVVIGQVMTSNGDEWSAFWSRGESPAAPPSPSVLRLGKAVGQDPLPDRVNETIAYFVFESGHGTFGGVDWIAGVGTDTIVGYDNGERVYPLTPALTPETNGGPMAFAAVAGMDGNDGGWANVTQVTTDQLHLFVDEDQLADVERAHTSEQVAYFAVGGPFVYPSEPECSVDDECDDGNFCNGAESCNGGICSSAGDPCGGLFCDETTDSCMACLDDADCDDGSFCNGAEVCNAGACASGTSPCGADACDEQDDVCAECFGDADCDSGTCVDNVCQAECDGELPYFSSFTETSDSASWYDTAANNSMDEANGFGRRRVGDEYAFGTGSTATNLHSHLVTDTSGTWSDYTYAGRMRMSSQNGGIGVTALSDYPNSDRYYRLRRWSGEPELRLSAHGTGLNCDVPHTGVNLVANAWYEFELRVDTAGNQTRVRARAWPEGTTRPEWQQDCIGVSLGQLTEGTIGVWTMGPGFKYWDDVEVTCN